MTGDTTLGIIADEILVAQAAGGNASAFDELVRRHFGRIFSIAYARLSDRDVAEELAQEVFLRIYLHLDSLRNAACFAGWAGTITRNMAANWRRNKRSRRTSESWFECHSWDRRHPAGKGRKGRQDATSV